MRRTTKVLVAGGLLATAAIVPAIAQAGAASDSAIVPAVAHVADSRLAIVPAVPQVGTASDSAIEPAVVLPVAQVEDDSDTPIGGSELDRASEVALAYMGGGRVTGTEIGDEESYYEVEVTLENGSQVDVQLDEQFVVVGSEDDGSDVEGSSGD